MQLCCTLPFRSHDTHDNIRTKNCPVFCHRTSIFNSCCLFLMHFLSSRIERNLQLFALVPWKIQFIFAESDCDIRRRRFFYNYITFLHKICHRAFPIFVPTKNDLIDLCPTFFALQPTSFGVPPVEIEDPRPRHSGRNPVLGYYPPAQRVMPRVSRKLQNIF